jgi:hypothetical protein
MDPAVEARFERIENALASVAVSQASVAMSQAAAEKRMERIERMMGAMTRLGRRWRSEANSRMAANEAWMERMQATLAEIGDKLNGLIGVVENWSRRKPNGGL